MMMLDKWVTGGKQLPPRGDSSRWYFAGEGRGICTGVKCGYNCRRNHMFLKAVMLMGRRLGCILRHTVRMPRTRCARTPEGRVCKGRGSFKPWEEEERYHQVLLATPQDQLSEVEKDLLRNWSLIERDPLQIQFPARLTRCSNTVRESGTHCILDLDGVSAARGACKAGPISEGVLIQCFGTAPPDT